ncbi:MAG: T9SS type A sorting domain-containing protein [Bacteroidales bacterium]|nr:T9SS type A sorting domain-containing protein [Bacteroidales bacterium]
MKSIKFLLFTFVSFILLGALAQVSPQTGANVKAVSVEELRLTSPHLLQTAAKPNLKVEHPSGGRWGSSCYDASYMSNLEYWYVGLLENPDDEIWFYFELLNYSENVSVSLCSSTFDTQLTIYDECDGNVIAYNDDADCGLKNPKELGTQSIIEFPSLEAGTYYVLLQGNNGETGEYWLKVNADQGFPSIYLDPDYLSETLAPGESSMQSFLVINFGDADLEFELSIDYLRQGSALPKDGNHRSKGGKSTFHANGNPKLKEMLKEVKDDFTVFYDDMESGSNGWSVADYTGNSANDLWHQTSQDYSSPTTSWWCADEVNGTYETGEIISNALISPPIDLTGVFEAVYLYFYESYDTEPEWDFCMVDVTTDGGLSWTPLRGDYGNAPNGHSNGWVFSYLDLSAYAGEEIQIRFYFDTGDSASNEYSGWLIDDVFVTTNDLALNWLSLWSFSYTVPPGWGYYVDATFDAMDLFPGTYYANVNVTSNDPYSPTVVLPVDLTVTEGGSGASCDEAVDYGFVNDPEQYGYLDSFSDVWYSFSLFDYVPNVSVSLCGSSFNTYLEVYSDCAGTLVSANDDYPCAGEQTKTGERSLQSQINYNLLAPGTYYVKISSTDESGDFVLNISQQNLLVPPTNLTADLNQETGEVSLNWDYFATEGFFEDFEDGIADNFVFSDPRFSVSDGYLKMNGTSTNDWASTYYEAIYSNFDLEFDFIRTQSENSNASTIGAFIRSDGFMSYNYPVNGYLVAFTVSGFYSVWLELNGSEYPVIPWTTTSFINTVLGETNSVMINADGSMIEIYINGNYLDSFTDSYFVSGYVNMCSYDVETGINEVLWDNVSLSLVMDKSPVILEKVTLPGTISEGTGARCFGEAVTNPFNEPKRFYDDPGNSGSRYFSAFNIYRDGTWLTSTSSTSYLDNLPTHGSYEYMVTAQYYWGESSAAGPAAVEWIGIPNIEVTPSFLDQELQPNQIAYQYPLISNTSGSGPLNYNVTITGNSKTPSTTPMPEPGFASSSETTSNVPGRDQVASKPFFNPSRTASGNVLIFRDNLAWGFNVNVPIFEALGATVSVASSADMATIDLAPYDIIVFESNQPNSFYLAYQSNLAKFSSFVSMGGTMLMHSATYSVERVPELLFPGGMKTRVDEYLSENNYVNNPLHPIVAGNYSPYVGLHASHESFENLPVDASVIVVDELGNPTLVEYKFGSGTVLVMGMTLEWGYANGLNYANLLPNAFEYALDLMNSFWLKVTPYNGTLAVSSSDYLYVMFNSQNLLPGTYTADININSNDPDQPLIVIPVTLTVTGAMMELSIPQGWSGISSYLIPFDPNVEPMFLPILSDLIILQSDYGVYWPGENINTIVYWNTQTGYKVKVANSVQLNIVGVTEESKTLYLYGGWNLIPVLSSCSVNVADFFAGHDVILVKEVAGWNLYWPGMGINTLGTMEPGKSYYVMMGGYEEITYPECGVKEFTAKPSELLDLSQFNLAVTPITHIVAIPSTVGNTFIQGDMIAAYDEEGHCYGVTVWKNETTALTLFGNDPTTVEKEGFNENEQVIFKLLRNSTDTEYMLNFSFEMAYPNNNALFSENGISVVKSVELSATGISISSLYEQIQIVPNPAKNEFSIQFPGGGSVDATLEIFRIDGQPVMGRQIIGQKQQVDISELSVGVYILQIEVNKQQFTRRLVKY